MKILLPRSLYLKYLESLGEAWAGNWASRYEELRYNVYVAMIEQAARQGDCTAL